MPLLSRTGFNPRPPVCRWATQVRGLGPLPEEVSTHAHLSVGGRRHGCRGAADAYPFQPTPTCLSVGDVPLPRRAGGAAQVSTHAHLSVGGRPPTPASSVAPQSFNPRPPVCRWATLGRFILISSHGGFQPTPTCLSVGDEAGGAGGAGSMFQPTPTCLSVGDAGMQPPASTFTGFNPRPPVCRWATASERTIFRPCEVSTHAHLSVGGRRTIARGITQWYQFQPTPTCLSVGDAKGLEPLSLAAPVSTHAHLSVGGRPPRLSGVAEYRTSFNPRPPVCRWATVAGMQGPERTGFQPTPTCLSVGDGGGDVDVQLGVVSTHAHLSVGGRPREQRLNLRLVEVSTHTHLSVGGRLPGVRRAPR